MSVVKDAEPQPPTALPTLPSPSAAPDDTIVSKDNGKRDQKADDSNASDISALIAALQPQPPLPTAALAPNVQTNVPADASISPPANTPSVNAPSVPQVNAPAPVLADTSLGAAQAVVPDIANSGGPAAQTSATNDIPTGGKPVASPTDPQPASQSMPAIGQNGPVAPNPAPAQQIALTDDSDSTANDAPPSASGVAKSDKPGAQNKNGDSKTAFDKAAGLKPGNNPPVDLQTISQPIPATDNDVEAAPQTVAVTPPVGASPVAPNGGDGVTAAQLANIAPAQTGKPDTKNAGSADKPVQAAANTNMPPPAVNPPIPSPAKLATSVPGKDGINGTDTLQTASNINGDNKPVHVPTPDAPAQLQQSAPAPVPQAAPAPVLPQNMATADFGVAPPAAGANGSPVTTSLHIATADADPTLNLGALAVSIAARVQSGAKQFDIRLDPPELGRVDVRLSIDASGKTQAHMTADQPQTLGLLQKDAPTLTQALRDAGLDVSQSGLNFSLRGQDRQNDSGGNGAGQGRRTNLTATRTIQAAQSPTAISFNGAAADARVDIHV